MSEKTTVGSYEAALRALEDGIEDIRVSSSYEGNEQAFKSCIEVLAKNATCKTLDLYWNNIGSDGAKHIANALKVNTSLQELNLRGDPWRNGIGNAGAIAIAEGLKANTSLRELNLWSNNIGPEGGIAIGNALKDNKSLRILNLSGNGIGVDGAKEIAEALKKNSTLQTLGLDDNEIGDVGTKKLAEALKRNSTLQTLSLGGGIWGLSKNNIGNAGAVAIAEALKTNTSLRELNLTGNGIGAEGGTSIGDALKQNNTLTSLVLQTNNIGYKGAVAIGNAILENNNSALLTLKLQFNSIGEEGINMLTEISKERPFLQIDLVDRSVTIEARKQLAGRIPGKKIRWGQSKLMVLGEGRAGKTQTIRSLLGDPFQPDSKSTFAGKIGLVRTTANENFNKLDPHDLTQAQFHFFKAAMVIEKRQDYSDAENGSDSLSKEREKIGGYTSGNDIIGDSDARAFTTTKTDSAEQYAEELAVDEQIVRKQMELRHEMENENRICFTIWDFAGQGVYKTVHHLFVSGEGVYMLVFDIVRLLSTAHGEESRSHLKFWLMSIETYASGSPLCIVGTHLDEYIDKKENNKEKIIKEVDEVLERILESLPNIRKKVSLWKEEYWFFPVDNRRSRGSDLFIFNEIRASLVKEANQLDSVKRTDVPMKWLLFLDSIRENLMAKPAIQRDHLVKEMEEFGISSEDALAMLRFCHKMGILLHWDYPKSLKDTIVLNPQWLIDAAARIIHSREYHEKYLTRKFLKQNKPEYNEMHSTGVVSQDLLERVLWSEDVFKNKIDFLVTLFRRQLMMCEYSCNPNIGSDSYLIPALLRGLASDCKYTLREKVQNKWDEYKAESVLEARICFGKNWCLPGLFEKLSCLCMAKVKKNQGIVANGLVAVDSTLYYYPGPIDRPVYMEYNTDTITIKVVSGQDYSWNAVNDINETICFILKHFMSGPKSVIGEIVLCGHSDTFPLATGKQVFKNYGQYSKVGSKIVNTGGDSVAVVMLEPWLTELGRSIRNGIVERPVTRRVEELALKPDPDLPLETPPTFFSSSSSWKEKADALYEVMRETSSERLQLLNEDGLKNLFTRSCGTVLEKAMKQFSDHYVQVLTFAGAIENTEGIWVTPGNSLEEKSMFEKKFSEHIKLMNKFWNSTVEIGGTGKSPMELTKECCERIDALALEIFNNGDKSAVVNAGSKGVFLSHRGPTQKPFADLLRQKFMNDLKFRNGDTVPIFLDIRSMIIGENNLENICYGICGVERIVALLDANFFTSEWCVLELFLASARRSSHGFQDNRLLPVYVQDNHIYRRDSVVNKMKGIPLPFDGSISYTQLTPSNPDQRLFQQMKDHFGGLEAVIDANMAPIHPEMQKPKVLEFARIGMKALNALINTGINMDRYTIQQDTKGIVLGEDILYPLRDQQTVHTEVIIKVTGGKVVGYFPTNGSKYTDAFVKPDNTIVFHGQEGAPFLLHPDSVSECLTDLVQFTK